MKRFVVATAVLLFVCVQSTESYPQELSHSQEDMHTRQTSPNDSTIRKPAELPWVYAHISMGFNIGWVRSQDYKVILDPIKARPVSLGYTLGITAGFRNIYQLEFRPRSVSMLNIYYSGESEDFDIEMAVHYRSELLHKLNLLFFKRGDSSGTAPCIFVTYGKSFGDDIRHVDANSDGFVNGRETIWGAEFGIISRRVDMTLLVERHQVTFERFRIQGYGEWVGDIDAAFWLIGLRMAVGAGI